MTVEYGLPPFTEDRLQYQGNAFPVKPGGIFNRAPTTADKNYPVGFEWQYLSSPSSTVVYVRVADSNIWQVQEGSSGGILPVSKGGTGAATLTAHGVLIGEGTSPVVVTAAGTDGQVLTANTGADPGFAAIGTKSGLTAHGLVLAQGTGAFTALADASNGQIPIGSTGVDPVLAAITGSPEITVTNGAGSIALTSNAGGSVSGAKFTLAAGTFSVTPNSAGSMTFVVPSNVTRGNFVRFNTATPFTFVDHSGSSTIAGALFGFQTTDAFEAGLGIPFYMYAASDSTDANLGLFITTVPNRFTLSSTIGKTGTASTAALPYDWFALGNPTVANFYNSAVTYVGKFRMVKVNNDWTVQALSNNDGINLFQDNSYVMSQAVLGAAAGSYFLANGGTAPLCTSNGMTQYTFGYGNDLFVDFSMLISADGVGAVQAQFVLPMKGGSGDPATLSGYRNHSGTILPIFAIPVTGGFANAWTMGLYDGTTGSAILNTGVLNTDIINLSGSIMLGGT